MSCRGKPETRRQLPQLCPRHITSGIWKSGQDGSRSLVQVGKVTALDRSVHACVHCGCVHAHVHDGKGLSAETSPVEDRAEHIF